MIQTENIYSPFICPFTEKELRLLTQQELELINSKIDSGELSFYSGIPVDFKLDKAYGTSQYLYIFPVIDGVTFLKKNTAITAKSRTANPHYRINNDDVAQFKTKFGFGQPLETSLSMEEGLEPNELADFKAKLPKKLSTVITANANSADDILNLIYEKKIGTHVHIDYRIGRLKTLKEELPETIETVLVDIDHLPFCESSLDAIVNFDAIDLLEKTNQLGLYSQAKKILKEEGILISAFKESKELHAQRKLNSDIKSKKALSLVAPWKRVKLPHMYFLEIGEIRNDRKDKSAYSQTSLSRQFG